MRKAASQKIAWGTLLAVGAIFSLVSVVYAWSTAQSACAKCTDQGRAVIEVEFRNTEPQGQHNAMNVVARDNVSGKTANLGTVNPGESKKGYIDVGTSAPNGTVTFELTWSDGRHGTDTRRANYTSVTCVQPSPSVSPSVSSSPSASPNVSPSVSPSMSPSQAPSVSPSPSPSVTPSVSATPSPSVVASTQPSVPPAPGGDGRSDGRTDSLGCQNPSDNCNPQAVGGVVLAANTGRSLPVTGVMDEGYAKVLMLGVLGTLLGLNVLQYAKTMENRF
ncbi:MAG: hypothetical protein KatS3mg087_0910 [Patescibacteria group bacterium]|nr:MAG: hypothetical protein KatS3mg087_0910 [Patescibacteria group bacterium]